jgi:hypothetical protein
MTPEEAQAGETRRFINSINAILTVAPVAKAGKTSKLGFDAARAPAANQAVNDAAGTGFFGGMLTDLGPEAAKRGPGVISKAIYGRSAERTTGVARIETVSAAARHAVRLRTRPCAV